MASAASFQGHGNVDDSATDALDRFINDSGCAEFHFKLQDCYADTKDWRKCQKEVKDFQNCVVECNKRKQEANTRKINT